MKQEKIKIELTEEEFNYMVNIFKELLLFHEIAQPAFYNPTKEWFDEFKNENRIKKAISKKFNISY